MDVDADPQRERCEALLERVPHELALASAAPGGGRRVRLHSWSDDDGTRVQGDGVLGRE